VLLDNPLLTLLGRRGRGAVVEALRRAPRRSWTVRDLARFADVPPAVASRAARELAALGAVGFQRPGRDGAVRFLPESRAGAWLAALDAPDVRGETARAFAAAYRPVAGFVGLRRWTDPGDDPVSPLAPCRIAVLVRRGEEAAVDAIGPALDAVREAGLPAPEAAVFRVDRLGDDAMGQAILAGAPL